MLSNEEKEVLASAFKDCAKVATLNAMTYVKKSFEGLKDLDSKWTTPLTLRQVCDYLTIYFDEVIKNMENQK